MAPHTIAHRNPREFPRRPLGKRGKAKITPAVWTNIGASEAPEEPEEEEWEEEPREGWEGWEPEADDEAPSQPPPPSPEKQLQFTPQRPEREGRAGALPGHPLPSPLNLVPMEESRELSLTPRSVESHTSMASTITCSTEGSQCYTPDLQLVAMEEPDRLPSSRLGESQQAESEPPSPVC